ncbi:MAG: helix-turn-helix transcriptional regulator, partial [Alphaproteobacteria bacterium]|nr:helix-turn-helix transcriptional regulator [Alphaproteobacteria bacterium]
MTPFGERLRELRAEKGITMAKLALALQVSPAYLSALEHGHKGRPSVGLLHQICAYFSLIWDDAEALRRIAALSHPKIVVDTSGLSSKATELANRIAEKIGDLDDSR